MLEHIQRSILLEWILKSRRVNLVVNSSGLRGIYLLMKVLL